MLTARNRMYVAWIQDQLPVITRRRSHPMELAGMPPGARPSTPPSSRSTCKISSSTSVQMISIHSLRRSARLPRLMSIATVQHPIRRTKPAHFRSRGRLSKAKPSSRCPMTRLPSHWTTRYGALPETHPIRLTTIQTFWMNTMGPMS